MASRWVGVDTILCIVVWPIFRPTIRIQPPTTKLQNVWRTVGSGSKLKKCSQMLANRLLSDTFVNACVSRTHIRTQTCPVFLNLYWFLQLLICPRQPWYPLKNSILLLNSTESWSDHLSYKLTYFPFIL